MCNAACVKIIINGGFMAVLAPQVGERYEALEQRAHRSTDDD